MNFCNFAVKITGVNDDENKYNFEIIDTKCFEINKKYYTLDNVESVEVFFIKNNQIFDIDIQGKNCKILKKKKLLFLEFANAFLATDTIFSFKNHNKHSICVGDIIFIRTNLLWNYK
jgi:hypothetical protein